MVHSITFKYRGSKYFEQVVLVERRQASHDPADTEGDHDEGDGVEATNAVSRQPRQSWEWSMTSMHRKHTHDVHALAIHKKSLDGHLSDGGIGVARKGPVLVSGGLDTSLSLYSVPAFRDKVGARYLLYMQSFNGKGEDSIASTSQP